MSEPKVDRICLISNYNLYESKRHFTAKFAEALERQGIVTLCIDAHETLMDTDVIMNIVKFKPTLTCSFNTILPMSSGQYLWDQLQIPHWSILVDPAIYNMGLAQSPYAIISCVDRGDFISVGNATTDRILFFPHAIERELTGEGEKHKDYDVVFIGSCYDYEGLRESWRQQHNEEVSKLLDHAIDIVLYDRSASIAESIVRAWNSSPIPPEGIDFFTLFYYIDYYTRGRERVELIRAIRDTPVHVFGETSKEMNVNEKGWDYYLSQSKNVILHPSVSFTDSMEILKRSKIALNSMPFFKDGTHERVFTALGCGAAPVTAHNRYWDEMFENNKEIALYPAGKWLEVDGIIKQLLENEPQRQQLVSAGIAKVQRDHTWDRRASDLLVNLPPLLERIQTPT